MKHILLGLLCIFSLLVIFISRPLYAASPVAGSGNYLDFDGYNDYVSMPYTTIHCPTTYMSLEFWGYSANWSNVKMVEIVSKLNEGAYGFWCDNTDFILVIRTSVKWVYARVPLSSISSGWHHFAMSYDNRYLRLYIDGDLKVTGDHGSNKNIYYPNSNALTVR